MRGGQIVKSTGVVDDSLMAARVVEAFTHKLWGRGGVWLARQPHIYVFTRRTHCVRSPKVFLSVRRAMLSSMPSFAFLRVQILKQVFFQRVAYHLGNAGHFSTPAATAGKYFVASHLRSTLPDES